MRNDVIIFSVESGADKPISGDAKGLHSVQRICAGAALNDKPDVIFRDNIGCNISDRNKTYCEITALYWLWRHVRAEYVGLCHYRRRFAANDATIDNLIDQKYDVILVKPTIINPSLKEQYKQVHVAEDWDKMMDAIRAVDPECAKYAEGVFNSNQLYPYNMGIYSYYYFDNYCKWLFPILGQVFRNIPQKVDNAYQNRFIGFMAERLQTLYFKYHETYLKAGYLDIQRLD